MQQALGRSALRVVRRNGRDLQVIASRTRIPLLRAIPGVAAASLAPSSYADVDPEDPGAAAPGGSKGAPVLSEGIERIGADALRPLADDGKGVVIAVLDLGFGGTRMPALQAAKELPGAAQLQMQSFDSAYGIAGRNAYGNLTNHGELVAQTVYDYAPKATYVFVNYHTEQDFQAAVDWLIQRHPDVVVHSNSFLEGPFDGTGAAAQAVDRASASGISWVNSAGNYAEKHWQGPWVDANQDDTLDWPTTGEWTFDATANSPITFALSWNQDQGAEITDLDLALDHREADGTWTEVASSRDSQLTGARSAERITNYLSPTGGTFRLRVVLAAGPPPGDDLTLFSREVMLDALGDPAPSSVPTPGDAESAITVGAVDWSNNALKAYSSRGPTDDGRIKPDVVAPTNTRVSTATGPKSVGGTSNAVPSRYSSVPVGQRAHHLIRCRRSRSLWGMHLIWATRGPTCRSVRAASVWMWTRRSSACPRRRVSPSRRDLPRHRYALRHRYRIRHACCSGRCRWMVARWCVVGARTRRRS